MIACLNVPYFAAAVERRDEPALTGKPVAIGGQPWEPQPVYAFSREVARQGVRPGMSLRLVHVLCPESQFIPAAPPRYLGASGEIADVLTDFTHLVEPAAFWLPEGSAGLKGRWGEFSQGQAFGRSLPARYTIDLESLPPVQGLALSQEIGRAMRKETCIQPAIGLAQSKFTAQVAAALTHINHARIIPAGEEAAFLASRSVHFLPLERETARRLAMLGIRTLGQLARMSPAGLQDQFGPDFIPLYRLAHGQTEVTGAGSWESKSSPVQALDPEKKESLSRSFEEPVTDSMTIERILAQMVMELANRLQAGGLESRTLYLTWEVENSSRSGNGEKASRPAQAILTRRQPTAGGDQLTESLHELFHRFCLGDGAVDLGRGFVSLGVTLTDISRAVPIQLSLFEPSRAKGRFNKIIANAAAKHGPGFLFRPELTDIQNPLPERHFNLRELVPL